MVVLGGGAVSYERGIPLPPPLSLSSSLLLSLSRSLTQAARAECTPPPQQKVRYEQTLTNTMYSSFFAESNVRVWTSGARAARDIWC